MKMISGNILSGLSPVSPPVLIGASTGGPEVLETLLASLCADAPPIAIVQHMPARFTATFAQRLDRACAIEVREARHGDRLHSGLALIAPGDRHMRIARDRRGYYVTLDDGEPVNRYRPSVDVLYESAARLGGEGMGVLLTGMGNDGAAGLLALRRRGALTLAQDEHSCAVFGMPRAALKLGAAARSEDVGGIAKAIRNHGRGLNNAIGLCA